MGFFKKKADPISEHERALAARIAALESQIEHLNGELGAAPAVSGPRLRSTARPHGAAAPVGPAAVAVEPIFETVDQNRLKTQAEPASQAEHFNDLGVRKYDLAGAFGRLKNNLRGPSPANPKLVNLLAAGSVQGLRPIRYEKRVARNRVIFLTIVLLVVLIGIFEAFRHSH